MKESTRIYLLRLLALAEAAAFVYPAVLVMRVVLFREDGGIKACLLYLLLLSLGFLAGRLLFREDLTLTDRLVKLPAVVFILFNFNISDKKRFISITASLATILIPLLTALLLFRSHGLLRVSFEMAMALIPYYMALRNSYSSFNEIMSRDRLTFGLILLLVSIEVASFYKPAVYLRPYFFAVAYFCILAFLILKNQEDIDSNIYNRKSIEKSILPRNLRSFNLKAVIVMFFVILLLFNLKLVVLFLMDMAGRIVRFVILVFAYIIEHIFTPVKTQGGDGLQPPENGFIGGGIVKIHPFWSFLGNLAMYFALMYLVYRIILVLIRQVPRLLRKLAELFRRLFVHSTPKSIEVGDYSDEVETVKPVSAGERKRAMRGSIRNVARNLKEITDPVERVRYIYGSLLEMLSVFGIKPEKYDTTTEILVKASGISGMGSSFSELTNIYDEVRYGEEIPGAASVSIVDNSYEIASELLKKGTR